jgi:hypothetical protein
MRAATRKRMISVMAELGQAGEPSRCPKLDIGWRKRPPSMTQPVISDSQCGYYYGTNGAENL